MLAAEPKRIVLTSFGTHGDIIPFVGIGKHLLTLGHRPVLAASSYFEPLARAHGLEFAPVAPHHDQLDRDLGIDNAERMQRAFRPTGAKFIFDKMVFPYLDQICDELDAACVGADMLVSQATTPWAYLIAHKRQLHWKTVLLQAMPLAQRSGQDPVFVSHAFPMHKLPRWIGARNYSRVFTALRNSLRSWVRPLDDKAKAYGVYDKRLNPMYECLLAPSGCIALLPQQIMRTPMPTDLPCEVSFAGFNYFDGVDASQPGLPAELQRFLNSGAPPLVFSLGSAVAFQAPKLYPQWSQLCSKLGLRAVFLDAKHAFSEPLPHTQFAAPWVSIAALFPRCAGLITTGGIGTSAQAVRAGLPQLMIPFGFDQFDNSYRLERIGAGISLSVSQAQGPAMEGALRRLVEDPQLREQARQLRASVNQSCGTQNAARLLAGELLQARLAA